MTRLSNTAHYIATSLQQLGFEILSPGQGEAGLPLVAFGVDKSRGGGFEEFAFPEGVGGRGWVVPAYEMGGEGMGVKILRVVVREGFEGEMVEAFLEDVRRVLEGLRR